MGYLTIKINEPFGKLFLSKIYIEKSSRGKRLAKLALEEIKYIAGLNEINTIWLTVNKNNLDTISVYERLGFIKTKEVQKDIGDGYVMDDYVMELNVL